MAAVAASYPELQKLDVDVLAVSVDSVFSHKVWQEVELSKMVEGGVPFPMITDSGGRIGSLYGVHDEAAGVDIRGRFLIDPDGVLLAAEVLTPPVGRSVAELLRQVRAFQHHQRTKELMPSGWTPGKPTLPPETQALSRAGHVWEIWKVENAI